MIIDRPDRSHIPALRRLWQHAFGDSDAFLDSFFRVGFAFDRCRCLHLDGKLAAALYWFDCSWNGKKVAYLYAVATDAALWGKGLCQALMEDTHKHLQSLGYAGAALVPGDAGLFSLYGKFGYRSFCPMGTVSVAAGEPVTVTPISPEDYRLRRQLCIGADAIVQDRVVTDFFATYGGFYRCGDTIFAASREENAVYLQEYLGDPGLLEGIVAALQAEKGIVKLPGGSQSAAMYLPLDNDPTLPDYFGLPLD